MIRTIYRGYDVTAEKADEWKVYDPRRPGSILATLKSESAAYDFIDKHKKGNA